MRYGLQVMRYGLQVMRYGLQVMRYGLQVMRYGLQVMRATGNEGGNGKWATTKGEQAMKGNGKWETTKGTTSNVETKSYCPRSVLLFSHSEKRYLLSNVLPVAHTNRFIARYPPAILSNPLPGRVCHSLRGNGGKGGMGGGGGVRGEILSWCTCNPYLITCNPYLIRIKFRPLPPPPPPFPPCPHYPADCGRPCRATDCSGWQVGNGQWIGLCGQRAIHSKVNSVFQND